MALEDDIVALKRVTFFSAFEEDALRLAAFGSRRLVFGEGAEIFREGQSTDGGYVILSGSVRLVNGDIDNPVKSKVAKKGELIGELALITRNKRAATAIAIEDVELLKIQRETIIRVLEEYPQIAARLYDSMSDSISEIAKDLEKVQRRLPVD